MKAFSYAAVAAIALAFSGAPAAAKLLQFQITNVGGTDRGNFLFQLDDSRVPNLFTASSVRFAAVIGGAAVPVRFFGLPGQGSGTAQSGVTFFTQTNQGGLAISPLPGGSVFQLKNTTLVTNTSFTAANRQPVFKLGTFFLSTMAANNGPRPFDNYRVVISAVPEPATWAMMLAGFGAIGLASRRRGTRAVVA